MVNTLTSLSNMDILSSNQRFYLKQKPPEMNAQERLSRNQKFGIHACTMAGVLLSLALLAKTSKHKYSLNLSKMMSTPFKDTFLGREEYGFWKVLTIGAGSCLGGLAGGMIFDKNKNNRQAKLRESLIQYTNISLPIGTVALASICADFLSAKMPGKGGKFCQMLFPLVGLAGGILAGNKYANKLNNKIFHKEENRPVELTDMSAHLDDICMTSQYIDKNNIITKSASRFIPLALLVAGNEIGRKQEKSK